jgi:endonuclease/exonuclease/phosphatase family metal-dependent hydrolase
MPIRVSGRNGRLFLCALIGLVISSGATAASAQTTVTLNQPLTQVVWSTLRGGSHANQTDQSILATRSANNLEYNRRALLKFNTQNFIPAGSSVTSALLTVTVKTGSSDATRSIGAYQVTTSWTEGVVTWNRRKSGLNWRTPGGDLGSRLDTETVSNAAGTKVTFYVPPLVKEAVAGRLGTSRYTRIALLDLEGSSSESYREYFTPEDSNVAARPVLKVTYGRSAASPPPPSPPPPPPPPPTGTGTTLRVLHWNTHHNGVRTDGVLDTTGLMKWVAKFNADLISLGEVERYGSGGYIDGPVVMANLLKQYTGRTWYYYFATLSGQSTGVGDLILSRFPIDSKDTQLLSGGRSINGVTINVNGRTINFSATHLHPDSSGYRLREIGELLLWAKGFAEQRIIAGDFNATATSAENAAMKLTYHDSWGVAQGYNTDIAYAGNLAGNTRNGRIDYIYYSRGAGFLTLKSSQVFDTRDANGVMPSDHRPLLSTFTVK